MSSLFPITPDQYTEYLKSAKWRVRRDKALRRDKHQCAECGSKFNLQVHHLTYERVGDELIEDLKTLCRKCHTGKHKGDLLLKLIKVCCERFLSQKPSEDINPRKLPQCQCCATVFEFKDIRFYYGINPFGGPPAFCENCIVGVRRSILKSKRPEYVDEIERYDPTAAREYI
jgi:hypothetical protein